MGTFRLCSQCVLQRETGQEPNVKQLVGASPPEPIFSLAYHFTQIILTSYCVISRRFCDVTRFMISA